MSTDFLKILPSRRATPSGGTRVSSFRAFSVPSCKIFLIRASSAAYLFSALFAFQLFIRNKQEANSNSRLYTPRTSTQAEPRFLSRQGAFGMPDAYRSTSVLSKSALHPSNPCSSVAYYSPWPFVPRRPCVSIPSCRCANGHDIAVESISAFLARSVIGGNWNIFPKEFHSHRC